jgi:hypothetical protein
VTPIFRLPASRFLIFVPLTVANGADGVTLVGVTLFGVDRVTPRRCLRLLVDPRRRQLRRDLVGQVDRSQCFDFRNWADWQVGVQLGSVDDLPLLGKLCFLLFGRDLHRNMEMAEVIF